MRDLDQAVEAVQAGRADGVILLQSVWARKYPQLRVAAEFDPYPHGPRFRWRGGLIAHGGPCGRAPVVELYGKNHPGRPISFDAAGLAVFERPTTPWIPTQYRCKSFVYNGS